MSARKYGRGHINETFLVDTSGRRGEVQFIIQRINQHVFRDPVGLMDNVRRVTEHLRTKSTEGPGHLSLVSTIDGQHFFRDEDAEIWRVFEFVRDSVAYESVQSARQARDAAAKFGEFQRLLTDLPGPRLNETIPDFHNTRARYRQFHDAVTEDTRNRARDCGAEIERAMAWDEIAGTLVGLQESGLIPERVVHNDTKLNNLLFDQRSGKAICVIDLDTVMPGLALHDFGDMVRTSTSPAAEDEADLSRIRMSMEHYEALVEGYLSATSGFLTRPEIEHLSLSGMIITIETGLRFLTDYLRGDEYFRCHRPGHNLDRCRAQFALAASIEEQLGAMQKYVADAASRVISGDRRVRS